MKIPHLEMDDDCGFPRIFGRPPDVDGLYHSSLRLKLLDAEHGTKPPSGDGMACTVHMWGGIPQMGVPPIAGWFVSWRNLIYKWMMTAGTPISGNFHVIMVNDLTMMYTRHGLYVRCHRISVPSTTQPLMKCCPSVKESPARLLQDGEHQEKPQCQDEIPRKRLRKHLQYLSLQSLIFQRMCFFLVCFSRVFFHFQNSFFPSKQFPSTEMHIATGHSVIPSSILPWVPRAGRVPVGTPLGQHQRQAASQHVLHRPRPNQDHKIWGCSCKFVPLNQSSDVNGFHLFPRKIQNNPKHHHPSTIINPHWYFTKAIIRSND